MYKLYTAPEFLPPGILSSRTAEKDQKHLLKTRSGAQSHLRGWRPSNAYHCFIVANIKNTAYYVMIRADRLFHVQICWVTLEHHSLLDALLESAVLAPVALGFCDFAHAVRHAGVDSPILDCPLEEPFAPAQHWICTKWMKIGSLNYAQNAYQVCHLYQIGLVSIQKEQFFLNGVIHTDDHFSKGILKLSGRQIQFPFYKFTQFPHKTFHIRSWWVIQSF